MNKKNRSNRLRLAHLVAWIVAIQALFVALPAVACWTPLEWQEKPVNWIHDTDRNSLDDSLDALIADAATGGDKAGSNVAIVVNLARCPEQTDINWLASYGNVVKMGRYVTFAAMENVATSDLLTIAQHPMVAFVEQMQGFTASLNVSGAAIKVRSSTTYPNNLEDLAPTIDGTGTTVAIIDSGVDDQDGAGTTHESFPVGKFVGGYSVGTGLGNPNDTDGHGTHVAGIAIGTGGTSGVNRGMAPGAGLVDCQTTIQCGPPSWLDVIECFEQIWTNDAAWQTDVVNLSLRQCGTNGATITSDGTDAASQLANFLVAQGITIVAAAGNDGPGNTGLTAPCAADNAICVAAMNDQGTVPRTGDIIANFSSRGPRANDGDLDSVDELKPEISAPGVSINSANNDTVSGYVNLSGTSMASPHVAGAAALIKQINPTINPGSIKNLMIQTAEDWGGAGWDADSGNGYLDVWAAASATASSDPAYPNHGTYPQPWLCTDISTATAPAVGVPNTVTVSVTNGSATAANNVEITFGVNIYSTGAPVFHSIGAQTVNIAAGATISVSHPWTPQPSPTGNSHACLKSSINYGFDTNFGNNLCQRNISVNQTGSPAKFTFQVQNFLKERVTIDLNPFAQLEFPGKLKGNKDFVELPGERIFAFDRWNPTVEETRLVMAPTDCPQELTLTLTVDPDATPVDGGLYSLPAIATPEDGEPVELGGVTAYGHTPCPDSWRGDADGDSVCGVFDNCQEMSNPEQVDSDGDGLGDVCDPTPKGKGPEPCRVNLDHPHFLTHQCLEKIRKTDLEEVIATEGQIPKALGANLNALKAVIGDGIFRAQVDFCKMKREVAIARSEATVYKLEVLEKIGQISPRSSQDLREKLQSCTRP